jgi:integrase
MQGHVRERKGKRGTSWAFVIELPPDPATGKRKQKWSSGYSTKAAAQKALREKLTALDKGDDPFPASLTVRSFVLDTWLPHLRTQGRVRERTIASYEQLWTMHAFPLVGGMELRALKPAHFQRVIDEMTAKGKRPRTVLHCRAAMSSAMQHALRCGVIESNPVRGTQGPAKDTPSLVTPTAEQLHAIIAAAQGTEYEVAMLLAATIAARRGEICALQWQHVDLDAGVVRIDGSLTQAGERTPPKTAKSARTVPLAPWVVDRLRVHKRAQAARLLALDGCTQDDETAVADRGDGQPLDPGKLTKAGKAICARAGVPGARLHDCRHGVLTELANRGDLDVASQIAGHSSLSFTMSVYTHPTPERLERQREALRRALG